MKKNISIYKNIINSLPIEWVLKIIEWEAFFLIDLDIPFDWTEREKFEIWDIVYWRSQKTNKFTIAIFYWNTKFDNFNSPTAASPAIKLWEITETDFLKDLKDWDRISIKIFI